METRVLKSGDSLVPATDAIKRGEVIAVPTETVYGLAADAMNEGAVRRIYSLKKRPADKPLSVLVSGIEDAEKLCCEVPDTARILAEKFWPGPLTMVLKCADTVPDIVTAGGNTLGVRCPDHEMTLEIIRGSAPLAAPSANISDMPSSVTVSEVLSYFDGQIPIAVDGGRCELATESTVLDMTADPPGILRRGALTKRDIKNAAGILPSGVTVLGITGGTGAGKTSALRVLQSMGVTVIDCDEVYHGLLKRADMLGEIEARFPGTVKGGALDRKALGAIVFADEAALSDLNAITHKYVDREVVSIIRSLEAESTGAVAAIDAIALIESGLSKRCDHVTAITAPAEKRVARIMERDGIDENYARSRINAQKSDEFYESNCDNVLVNDADENSFSDKCRDFFSQIISAT